MYGVDGIDLLEQISFLDDLRSREIDWLALDVHAVANKANGQGTGYGIIEAEVLHAFIRRHRPKRIIQIGCGLSTAVMLRAAALARYTPDIVCIEPFPSAFLLNAQTNRQITLYGQPAEEVPASIMTELADGDLLFVDSTHIVKPGSEVNRIILDILPRLTSGVFVHFHDIYFPYDYPRNLLSDALFFPSESTLLHAYLINNPKCRIVLSLSMLHYGSPASLAQAFPRYSPQANADGLSSDNEGHFPSSIYLLTGDSAVRALSSATTVPS
jgi:hypothetical protein